MNQTTTVSAEWLCDNLDAPNLIILDATMRDADADADAEHSPVTIPHTRFFDLKNTFKDTSARLPNTAPSAHYFSAECQKLGINSDSQIVIFDEQGIFSSPRAWWLFKLMGHDNVAVLDGGLPHWIRQGYETVPNNFTPNNKVALNRNITLNNNDATQDSITRGNFVAQQQDELLLSFDDIAQNAKNAQHSCEMKAFTVVDARSHGRFTGTVPEPRKGLKSGSIPNSVNVPYESVLDDGLFKTPAELRAIFAEYCNSSDELVFSCGSGLTACIIMLACEISFKESKRVYDGSWTEWAERNNLTTDETN